MAKITLLAKGVFNQLKINGYFGCGVPEPPRF